MTAPITPDVYYVALCTLKYGSREEAKAAAPTDIAAHVERSQELHRHPLYLAGMMQSWDIRAWANMFAWPVAHRERTSPIVASRRSAASRRVVA